MTNNLALKGGPKVRTKSFGRHPIIGDDEISQIMDVLKSGNISTFAATPGENFLGGKKIKEFEEKFSKKIGTKFGVVFNSASSALHAAVVAVGVRPEEEVIVPPLTFTSTATSSLMHNAIPVFCDVKEDTYCLDPTKIESVVSPLTKAIIPVHLFGHPCDMDELLHFANKHDLKVIEDCAQAPGAKYKGKTVGTLGDCGIFSFQESKNIMTGEGGMLLTDNEDIASDLARELDEENKRRREIQDAVFEDALLKVNAEIDLSTDKAIVVWGKDWHPGVVGIVASKLKEEFHRPAIVISMKEHGLGTGSARSIRGLNLYDALTKVKSTLEGYGGHPMAAGLTVKEENCDSFRSSFVSIANECLSDDDLIPGITVEGELKLNDITPRFMDFLDKLSPFGPGNMRPKFFASNVEISGIPKVIGGGNHIRFTVRQNGTTYGAIGFNLSEHYQDLITGNPIDLAFVVEINEWQNRREIQLNVRDIKLTPNAH